MEESNFEGRGARSRKGAARQFPLWDGGGSNEHVEEAVMDGNHLPVDNGLLFLPLHYGLLRLMIHRNSNSPACA